MTSFLPLRVLAILLVSACPLACCTSYTIDPTPGLGLPFDGIGALSAGASSRLLPDYGDPYRSDILDYLFLPGYGAALQILKVEIGGDAQSTEGTEASHMHVAGEENYQRGYEWWLMAEAKARNPAIQLYGLSWGFPGWVAEGGSSPLTNSTVQYIVKWLLAARDVHGLTIDYIGIWNERDYSSPYIVSLHAALQSNNLSTTRIVAADDCCPQWNICDDMLTDAAMSAAVTFIGGHYPNEQTTASCVKLPQRKWSSEDFSSPYTAGGCWSRLLNRNYVYANLTSTIAWSPIAAYYDELPYSLVGLMHAASPWSGHYDVDQAIWATAHHTHHYDIGWQYLAHGSGVGELAGGGTYIALTDGSGGLTIVVEAITHEQSLCINDGYAPGGTTVAQNVTFTLGGSFASLAFLHTFYSSFDPAQPVVLYEYQGAVQLVDGAFTFTLLPDTLYTFSTRNASKGAHPPPPPVAAFPDRYSDSFDAATLYGQARYLTDQSGVFELFDSGNSSHGGVVRQVVPAMPVSWCGDAVVAYSLLGNHSWQHVRAAVDVLVEAQGTAVLAAAISTGGCTGAPGSPAIALALTAGGQWTLSNTTSLAYSVASGGQYVAGRWYRLQLSVTQDGIAAAVDGEVVCKVKAADWVGSVAGWAGIGSSFDHVQFDNLEVDATVQQAEWKHGGGSSEHRHGRG